MTVPFQCFQGFSYLKLWLIIARAYLEKGSLYKILIYDKNIRNSVRKKGLNHQFIFHICGISFCLEQKNQIGDL